MNKKDLVTEEGRLLFCRELAREGVILLKNEDNLLPLKGGKTAVFGTAQIEAQAANEGIRVDAEKKICITDALIREGVDIDKPLYEKYKVWHKNSVLRQYGAWSLSASVPEMEVTSDLVKEVKERGADTAIIVIRRSSYENVDMEIKKGDYLLSDSELEMIKNVTSYFSDVILLLHIGCNIDLGFLDDYPIKSILYLNQLGVNGALGMADIITGKVSPSGKLTFSMAKHFEDYPCARNFGRHGGGLLQKYEEDIFVGYRYFETFPEQGKNLVFPFGFGLSYTNFEITDAEAREENGEIKVYVNVKNTGNFPGKEVLQLYFSAPSVDDGAVLGAPAKQLRDFVKTGLLNPGESERVSLALKTDEMASFDDLGKLGSQSSYVMEKGKYGILLGTDSKNTRLVYEHYEKNNRIIKKCCPINTTLNRRLTAHGTYELLPVAAVGRDCHSISSIEKTVIKVKECIGAKIEDFSELKKGESIQFKLQAAVGGSYTLTFGGGTEGNTAESVNPEINGIPIKSKKIIGSNTIELKLPLNCCILTLSPLEDNISFSEIVFEKTDTTYNISADCENVIDAANMYESDIWIDVDYDYNESSDENEAFITNFDIPGRTVTYRLCVAEAGTYRFAFRYNYCHESRPVNECMTLIASNIVEPLGGGILRRTQSEGEKRAFKKSEDYIITLKSGICYLKIASEKAPFPEISKIYLTKFEGNYSAEDIDSEKILEENKEYVFIPKQKLLDNPDDYPKKGIQFWDVMRDKSLMPEFLEQLSNSELATLLSGTSQNLTEGGDVGCTSPVYERGIPAAQTADGPCGLRQHDQYPIAFPSGIVLASTFNREMFSLYGYAMAEECLHYGVDYLLGPGINILRSPTGGRNCAYFSEDPYVSGIVASYYVNAVQDMGVAAVVKHFAANNTEFERLKSNSRISARALREIYMKAFEIVCAESDPWVIMSSYNYVNDVKVCENRTLITEIPREEWGWNGIFFTDWWNDSQHVKEIKAGHDVKMATGEADAVTRALDTGVLSRSEACVCGERILLTLMKLGRIKKIADKMKEE